MRLRVTVAAAVLLAGAVPSPAAAVAQSAGGRAYVTAWGSDTVTVVDLATDTVVATILVGDLPRGVAVTPDGTRVYVSNELSNTVSVIDTATNAVVTTVPVGEHPVGIRSNPSGTEVWVANDWGGAISVIGTATNTVIATVATSPFPHDIAFLPDGSRAYASTQLGDVNTIDTVTRSVVASVDVGHSMYGIEVMPDGSRIYVTATSTDSFGGGIDLLASATAGRAIFQWLLFFMLLLVCFIVPGLTAGAISGERERQTMVALQLTLLRPRSIVAGKLLASLAFVVLLIIASLPLVTVPFLVGGVSLPEVVKGLWMVLATAVTLACLTLACSALLRRTQAATVVAYGLTLGLVLGTLMIYAAQQIPRSSGTPRPRPWILALNPFAATADVVQGRNESNTLDSPFSAMGELLRLSDEDRFSAVITGSAEARFGPGGPVFAGDLPAIAVAPPATAVGRPAQAPIPLPMPAPRPPDGPFIDVGGPDFGQFGPIGPVDVDDGVELGGVRFWVVSLWAWLVLAVAAVVLTVRRISLPASREA